MQEINTKELYSVVGAKNYPTYPRNPYDPAVISCNNGIIGGMIAGVLGGIPGLTLGLIGGAIAGGCFNR